MRSCPSLWPRRHGKFNFNFKEIKQIEKDHKARLLQSDDYVIIFKSIGNPSNYIYLYTGLGVYFYVKNKGMYNFNVYEYINDT